MTTTTHTCQGIERFLAAAAAGRGGDPDAYAADAVLDATEPGWRFTRRGPAAIAAQYAAWFPRPVTFEELVRRPVAGGEVVTYLQTFERDGVPHAAHRCHVFAVGPDGRITRDQTWCGGQWDAALLARMAEANDAG